MIADMTTFMTWVQCKQLFTRVYDVKTYDRLERTTHRFGGARRQIGDEHFVTSGPTAAGPCSARSGHPTDTLTLCNIDLLNGVKHAPIIVTVFGIIVSSFAPVSSSRPFNGNPWNKQFLQSISKHCNLFETGWNRMPGAHEFGVVEHADCFAGVTVCSKCLQKKQMIKPTQKSKFIAMHLCSP